MTDPEIEDANTSTRKEQVNENSDLAGPTTSEREDVSSKSVSTDKASAVRAEPDSVSDRSMGFALPDILSEERLGSDLALPVGEGPLDGPVGIPHADSDASLASRPAMSPSKTAHQARKATAGPALMDTPPLPNRFPRHHMLAGRYRLESTIAKGGMGWVFLATQLPLGRPVAVKVLVPQPGDAAFRRRFLLEASTCAKLTHPNIVTVHDYGESEAGDMYMVMEHIEGRSLARVLLREKRVEPDRACRIILQILRALRVAHRAGIVHRDLKPSNVMLLEDPEHEDQWELVKVVDFGLAKVYSDRFAFGDEGEGEVEEMTRAGLLLGSPRYMPPEQIRNHGIDPRTDIYSLGVLFHSMLAGKPPFDGATPTDIMTQQLRDPPPRLLDIAPDLDIPRELDELIRCCMYKDPKMRPQSADEVVAELRSIYMHMTDASEALLDTSTLRSFDTRRPSMVRAMNPEAMPPLPEPEKEDEPRSSSGVWWMLAIFMLSLIGTMLFWMLVLDNPQ